MESEKNLSEQRRKIKIKANAQKSFWSHDQEQLLEWNWAPVDVSEFGSWIAWDNASSDYSFL